MKAILALSILLNLALAGWLVWGRPADAARAKPAVVAGQAAKAAPVAPAAVAAPEATLPNRPAAGKAAGSIWTGSRTDLLAWLRASGAPDETIAFLMFNHGREDYRAKRLAIMYPKGFTRWAARNTDTGNFEKLRELSEKNREELRRELGPEFDLLVLNLDPQQMEKWGNLTDGQRLKIQQLDEEYNALRTKTSMSRTGLDDGGRNLIDAEYEADIRAALPPAQAEDFLAFNSKAAQELQRTLGRARIDIDEATYRELYRRMQELDAELGVRGRMELSPTRTAREARIYDAVAGPESALAYAVLKEGGFSFKPLDAALASDGRDARARADLYYEYTAVSSRIWAGPGQGDRTQIAAEGQRFYNLLASKMSPQKLEEFLKSPQGAFLNNWRRGSR